jgi:phosphoglycolate phosphatase-like HAD superfamily hydrolase
MKKSRSKAELTGLQKKHEVLFAIDSDGCVFDSMAVKQRIFHDGMIEFWALEDRADEVRRICEWIGLYSPWRGLNRFQLILRIFQALNETGTADIATASLEKFTASGVPLSMAELAKHEDADLRRVLEWSTEMSRRIAALPPSPVFDEVPETLETLHAAADLIVVSQTTEDALVREWNHVGLTGFTKVIAGAESGSKADCLCAAMAGRYGPEQTMMVGDAPGDLEAARVAGALFFPIIPGAENESWRELRAEGAARVLNGTFRGMYQEDLIARFDSVLSAVPPPASNSH